MAGQQSSSACAITHQRDERLSPGGRHAHSAQPLDTGLSYGFDGNLYGSNGFYSPTRFQLTTHDGRVLILDTVLGLVSETDRNGNSLTVDSSGVHASNGQSITYTSDPVGRITQITGPSGQLLSFGYSAAGDLASSTDPDSNMTTYTYDGNHDLLSATGPSQTRPLTTLNYDSSGRLAPPVTWSSLGGQLHLGLGWPPL